MNVDYGTCKRQFVRLETTKDKVNGQKRDIVAGYPEQVHALKFKISGALILWTLVNKVHTLRSKQQGCWTAKQDRRKR